MRKRLESVRMSPLKSEDGFVFHISHSSSFASGGECGICGLAEIEGTLVTEEATGDECETQSGDFFIASSIARSTSGWPRMLSVVVERSKKEIRISGELFGEPAVPGNVVLGTEDELANAVAGSAEFRASFGEAAHEARVVAQGRGGFAVEGRRGIAIGVELRFHVITIHALRDGVREDLLPRQAERARGLCEEGQMRADDLHEDIVGVLVVEHAAGLETAGASGVVADELFIRVDPLRVVAAGEVAVAVLEVGILAVRRGLPAAFPSDKQPALFLR